MRIKLINPHDHLSTQISSAATFKMIQLSLPLLAAMTPDYHSVSIVDESFAPDNPDEDVDLVGISVLTDLASRAYQITDDYRRRGAKVVLGGIHPTVLPQEALQHADAVVQGEGELVWGKVLSDVENDRLQKIYRSEDKTELEGLPIPHRDLYPHLSFKSYTPVAVGVETSRGCPYDCEFCCVSQLMGQQYRIRPISEVIAEIETIQHRTLFFADDNIALNRRKSKELFREMVPLKCRWVGQGAVDLAEDMELLQLMKASGCEALLVGFESVQRDTRDSMRKLNKLKIGYDEVIRRFHGAGISILGAFIFGFDHETKDIFDQTLEFVMKHHLDMLQLRILTPYPGTGLYERLLRENRLIEPNWWLKGMVSNKLLFQPKGMTMDDLINGMEEITRHVCSLPSIVNRYFGINPLRRSSIVTNLYFGYNLAQRKRYRENYMRWNI